MVLPRVVLLLWSFSMLSAFAAPPAAPHVPDAAKPSANFNVKAATAAWLATVPATEKAKSDSYFEGGYWFILWDFLATAAVMLFLLGARLSARIRDLTERLTRFKWLQSWLYWLGFTLVSYVLIFPLAVYEGFVREHKYDLSNLTFAGWLSEEMKGLALSIVLGGFAFTLLVSIVRRSPHNWHVWSALAGMVLMSIAIVISPILIAPLFNEYKPLKNQIIKERILSLARANGIPVSDVYEVDASKQSKRVSANVSGFLGTERITLNDNLLARCSPAAIEATMGHEMGHYVLHHIYDSVIFLVIVIAAMFWMLRRALEWMLARWGRRWGIRGLGDTAALPAAVLILSALGFFFTPISNSFTREQEYQADLYGINTSRQPDGEAEVDLLLGEYRKLDPTPLEEMVFFDHPSGRTRINAAMRWKAENLCLFDASLPCTNRPTSVDQRLARLP